jgi:hypothetical protein
MFVFLTSPAFSPFTFGGGLGKSAGKADFVNCGDGIERERVTPFSLSNPAIAFPGFMEGA